MNQELKERLEGLGMTEDQIEKLGPLGVTEEADLAYLKTDDLESIGIAPIRARRIIGEFQNVGQSKTDEPSGLMPELAGTLKNLASAIARKPVTEWSIAELIAGLVTEPENDQLHDELQSRQDYIRARGRTKSVIARKDGEVNPLVSQKYIRALSKGSPVLDQFEAHQLVSPELAFGQKISRWRHPLISEWVITNGVDEAGLTWESKDLPRIRMAIWARDIRRHPLFPRDPDPVNEHSALTSENLVGRWAQIWQAYQLWLEEGNEEPNVNVREGRDGSMPPFAQGDLFQVPPNLPHSISLPDHVLYASVLTTHLTRQEMHELTHEVGERPGSICSGDREDRTYARELVGHLSRRSRVYELIEALYRLYPQVNWAAEFRLVEKAGTGDTIIGSKYALTGNFTGAQINIGDKN